MPEPSPIILPPSVAPRGSARWASIVGALAFGRHYLEMVLAMGLGMLVLAWPLDAALELGGAHPESWGESAPELSLLAMGVTMTVPMAAWMRVRGHGWQATAEMSAAMLIPTVAAMAAVATDFISDLDAVYAGEHTAMFLAMFLAMLWRRSEYACAQPAPSGANPRDLSSSGTCAASRDVTVGFPARQQATERG